MRAYLSQAILPGIRIATARITLPWQCALELAEAFARVQPATVLAPIDAQEQRWSRSRSLEDHDVTTLLVRYLAAWAGRAVSGLATTLLLPHASVAPDRRPSDECDVGASASEPQIRIDRPNRIERALLGFVTADPTTALLPVLDACPGAGGGTRQTRGAQNLLESQVCASSSPPGHPSSCVGLMHWTDVPLARAPRCTGQGSTRACSEKARGCRCGRISRAVRPS